MGVSSPSYFINHIIKNKKNMENSIVVPFDLNTARKIKSGEIEGMRIPERGRKGMYVFLSAFCYGLFLHCYYHQLS